MMSFTKDGQVNPALIKERDERLGKDSQAVKEARKDLQPAHPIAAAADHWEVGGTGHFCCCIANEMLLQHLVPDCAGAMC